MTYDDIEVSVRMPADPENSDSIPDLLVDPVMGSISVDPLRRWVFSLGAEAKLRALFEEVCGGRCVETVPAAARRVRALLHDLVRRHEVVRRRHAPGEGPASELLRSDTPDTGPESDKQDTGIRDHNSVDRKADTPR